MQVAALERLVCLVKVGSRTVLLVTPAFQSNGSCAEIQRRCSFPFGSLRLPRVPLGGFATSRSPLAAVAARGAVHNINDHVENVDKVLLVSGIFLEKCCLGATLL